MAQQAASARVSGKGYVPPPNIWDILQKQLAFLAGDHECPDTIVCIPEQVSKAVKQKDFLASWKETLKYLKHYCCQGEPKGKMSLLIRGKNIKEPFLTNMTQTVVDVFGPECVIVCQLKSKTQPAPGHVKVIEKNTEFADHVGGVGHLPKDFFGTLPYTSTTHKDWIGQRKELGQMTTDTKRISTRMNAEVGKMEPDYSRGAILQMKQILKRLVETKSEVYAGVRQLEEKLTHFHKMLVRSVVFRIRDSSVMLEQVEKLRMSLDSAKYAYDDKREPYKAWLEWRIECIGHADRMDTVKAALKTRVESFSFTLDKLKDVHELRDCVVRCKEYVEGLKEFALAEASSELSSLRCVMEETERFADYIPRHQQRCRQETEQLLAQWMEQIGQFSMEMLAVAEEKIEVMSRCISLHLYIHQCGEWCKESTKTLAAACAYDGQDKSQKARIIESLLSQVKARPVMDLTALTSSEKLTELFTADIQEAKLKTDEVNGRLARQLKAWGHSLDSTDGQGMENVYYELVESEENYVRDLEVVVEGYLKAVKEGDEVVPVKIRERPEEMFGNIEDIFNLHSKGLLLKLKQAAGNPKLLRQAFTDTATQMEDVYGHYCKHYDTNKDVIGGSRAEVEFYREMEIRLSHVTGLPTLMTLPCKRLMVYKQLLCNMLKEARNQDSRSEIQTTVSVLDNVLKSVDVRVKQKYGRTLLDDVMKVRLPHVSTLRIKHSFRPRHVILHEMALSICRTTDAPKRKGAPFSATVQEKAVIKLVDFNVPQVVTGAPQQFTLLRGKDKKDVFLFEADSRDKCKLWVDQICKMLHSQLEQAKEGSLPIAQLKDLPTTPEERDVTIPSPPTTSLDLKQGSNVPLQPKKSKVKKWLQKRVSAPVDDSVNPLSMVDGGHGSMEEKPAQSPASSLNGKQLKRVPSTPVSSLDSTQMRRVPSDNGYNAEEAYDSFEECSDDEGGRRSANDQRGTLWSVSAGYRSTSKDSTIAVNSGEVVEVFEVQDGWCWVRRLVGENAEGWVPETNLLPLGK